MKEPHTCQNMEEIREAIDTLDHEIVERIAKRSHYVLKASQFKKDLNAVRDSERVKAVIASKKKLAAHYGVSPKLIEILYTEMIDFFIKEEVEAWECHRKKGE